MIYNFVLTFILLNVIYELLEVIFPSSKMQNFVKSFVLIVILYAASSYICSLL